MYFEIGCHCLQQNIYLLNIYDVSFKTGMVSSSFAVLFLLTRESFLFFKNGLNVSVLLFETSLSWIRTQTHFDLKTREKCVGIPVCAKK